MVKDGVLIDTMLGWIFNLTGWILSGIVKLLMAIVVGPFNGIAGLFKNSGTGI